MILSKEQRELRGQIEIVSYYCIHAIEYFNGVTGKGGEFWTFTQNCYGNNACLFWRQIFNSYNKDKTHYYNLFGDDKLESLSAKFCYSEIKNRLISTIGLTEAEYDVFRKQVVDFRNQYGAHREYDKDIIFPELDIALRMCLEMRNILEETIKEELKYNPDDSELLDDKEYYEWHQNRMIINKCHKNIGKIQFFE